MKLFVLLLLLIPAVCAVEVPLVLNVDTVSVAEKEEIPELEHISVESTLEEAPELSVTGAVAYEESDAGKPWALWLIVGVAASIAVILVLRR